MSKLSIPKKLHRRKKYQIAIISALLETMENDNRPHTKVQIFNDNLIGLLDSGANITVIGKDWDKLIKKWKISVNKKRTTVRTADGTRLKSPGSVLLPINYNGQCKMINATIVPEIQKSLIFGMDFWNAFGIVPSIADLHINELTLAQAQQITLKSDLTNAQRKILTDTIKRFEFTQEDSLGTTNLIQHRIEIGDAKPFKLAQYTASVYVQEKMHEEIDRMLKLGIIEPIERPEYQSPIFCVPKKNGKVRCTLDARHLNSVTRKQAYPSHNANRILTQLRGNTYLSTIDIKDAFYNILIRPEDRKYTAFSIPGRGSFCYRKMAMGLTGSVSTWCELADRVIGNDLEPYCYVFIDDIIIATDDFDEHIRILETVLKRLNEAGLTANPEKSKLCRKSIRFLGIIIDDKGLRCDPDKVRAINELQPPKNLKQLRRINGMCQFHAQWIKDHATIIKPITDLMKNAKKMIHWTKAADDAFNKIKQALTSADVLALPRYDLPFHLACDASEAGAGAVLTQFIDNKERPIAYYSSKFSDTQSRYTVSERECLAVILALEKFRHIIQGSPNLTIYTDHASLIWLNNFKLDHSGKIVRWAMRMQNFLPYTIKHRKGTENVTADILSRAHEIDVVDFASFENTNDKDYLKLVEQTFNSNAATKDFAIQNDLLYKQYKAKDKISFKLYVPKDCIEQVLYECHDDKTASHGGFFKTRHRVHSNYYWPSMDSDIRNYLKKCVTCKCAKAANHNARTPMADEKKHATAPWETIHIDFLGPLPRSKNGNRYVISIVDEFSKFSIVTPCREATATKVKQVLEEKVFLTFGPPSRIICDNGTQFKSKLFTELCEQYRIKIRYTAFHHSQANASECTNKQIGNAIRCYVNENNHKDWDRYMPHIQCAINTSKHTATNDTAYNIIYGRKFHITGQHRQMNANANGNQKEKSFEDIYKRVGEQLKKAYETAKNRYNLRARQIDYNIGDIVFRRNYALSSKINDFSAKLAPVFIKCQIIEKKNNVYKVKDLNSNTTGTYQAKDLKK